LDAAFTACTGLQSLSLTLCYEDSVLPPYFFNLSSLKRGSQEANCEPKTKTFGFGFLLLETLALTEVDSHVGFYEIPDEFGKLICLKKLMLDELESDELPESICQLTWLTELQISRCELRHLPSSFGNLSSLVKLSIFYLDLLEDLPDSIGRLQNLQECSLKGFPSVSELPDSLFSLTSLRALELASLENVQRFSSAMSNLVSLESLTIKSRERLSPFSLRNLANLRFLTVRICPALGELPKFTDCLSSLEHLELGQLGGITRLPNTFARLSHLRLFSFNHCSGVSRLPSSLFQNCWSSLTALDFGWPSDCPTNFNDDFLDSLCDLSSLSKLCLSGLLGLIALPEAIYNLQQLRKLTLCCCPESEYVYFNRQWFGLTSLQIMTCPTFKAEDDYGTPHSKIPDLKSGCIDGRPLGGGAMGVGE
ncbi:hypothetical protein CLOM_g22611, partial [Closterium sp. NIES-68]